jgi:homoserine O-acetyltransferase
VVGLGKAKFMAEDIFQSSDSIRTAHPLRYVQSVTLKEPLHLESGGDLPGVTVAYETYGRLNKSGDNAILICHAISGDSHVARHNADDEAGWWDIMVGPGKPVDTDRFLSSARICSPAAAARPGPAASIRPLANPTGRIFRPPPLATWWKYSAACSIIWALANLWRSLAVQ